MAVSKNGVRRAVCLSDHFLTCSCFVVAISDLMHEVETVNVLYTILRASGFFYLEYE